MSRDIFIATGNQGKIKELVELLDGLGLTIHTPLTIGRVLEVGETGKTYQENAIIKAKAYASQVQWVSLADDSGLEVDALNGAPGVFSARFSPQPGATDGDRRQLMLEKLAVFPRPWTARFRCAVAIVTPDTKLYVTNGVCDGEIIPEERGNFGFGYDPIFLVSGTSRTMAELPMEDKNRLSHRAKAILAARSILKKIFVNRENGDPD